MYYSLKVPASECSAQSHELLLEFVTDLYSWKHMYFPLNQWNIIRTQLYFAKNHLHSVRGAARHGGSKEPRPQGHHVAHQK